MKNKIIGLLSLVLIASINPAFAGGPVSTTGTDPNQKAIVNSINSGVRRIVFVLVNVTPKGFLLATDLNLMTPANRLTALSELSPEQFGRFTSITAFNNASFETEAMDQYLAGRRDDNGLFFGGNGKLDASGLTVNDPNYDPTLAMVHSRLMAWNPGPTAGTVSDMSNPLLAGMEMKDSKDMKSMAEPGYTDPWHFFVRGSVVLAQGFSDPDTSHFGDSTESVEIGTDYRINPNFLVGLTAGYGHTDADLDDEGSSATVDSYSTGLYASYADKGWYADVTGSYVHNTYTESRDISFLREVANGAPEGDEGVANIDGGYDFHIMNGLTVGPLAGLQYTHLTVGSYTETGAPLADLGVDAQQADSLRSRLGGRVSYAFTFGGMTFHPHLDATWQHEFMDQSRGITSGFIDSGLASFDVRTENPSRDFALADVGIDADINRTINVFFDYAAQAGQQNYFGQSVQGGVRVGF